MCVKRRWEESLNIALIEEGAWDVEIDQNGKQKQTMYLHNTMCIFLFLLFFCIFVFFVELSNHKVMRLLFVEDVVVLKALTFVVSPTSGRKT